jgi:hypothetical protein
MPPIEEPLKSDKNESDQSKSAMAMNLLPDDNAIIAPTTNWHIKETIITAFVSVFLTLTLLTCAFIFLNDYIVLKVKSNIDDEQIDIYIDKALQKYINQSPASVNDAQIDMYIDKALQKYINQSPVSVEDAQIEMYISKALQKYINQLPASLEEVEIDMYIDKALQKYINQSRTSDKQITSYLDKVLQKYINLLTTNTITNITNIYQDRQWIEFLASAIIAEEQRNADKKADSLVDKARLVKEEDANTASLLYWAALDVSTSKSAILQEYIDWQKSIIDLELDNNNYTLALERMGGLLNLIDAHLHKGTVEDLLLFAAIRDELENINAQITQRMSVAVALQQGIIETIKRSFLSASFSPARRGGYVQALSALEFISPFPEVDDSLEEAIELASARLQACDAMDSLYRDGGPVVAPVDQSMPVAEAWLKSLGEHLLTSNAPVSQLLLEYETGLEYQATLDFELDGQISGQLAEAERRLSGLIWTENVERLLSETSSNTSDEKLGQLDQLFNQGMVLLPSNDGLQPLMCKLATTVFEGKLLQVAEGMDNMSSLENSYGADVLQQVAAQYRIQVAFLALEFEGAKRYIPELSQVTGLNTTFNSLMSSVTSFFESYGENQQVSASRRFNFAKEQYQHEVSSVLSEAKNYYDSAENDASGWNKTRSNNEVQAKYRSAFRILMKLDSNDVNSFALREQQALYNELMNNIQQYYTPANNEKQEQLMSIRFDDILSNTSY